jgi:nucleoside-diphosphate-sugar epimerase
MRDMRVLIIGGTGLSGPFLVRELLEPGHRMMLFHRGTNAQNVPAGVEQIIAPMHIGATPDRYHLRAFASQFRAFAPEVVVHMIAFKREDAEIFIETFRGVARRAVVASSSDVYRVMGILNRTETGPPVPVPIDEDGPLREKLSIHGERAEKRWVEQVVLSHPELAATVLRFPAIYGPGSYRRNDWIKRMLDDRPAILIGKGEARFRFTHSYAEDVGHAMALAVVNDRAAGRIYNVGERDTPTERQRLEDFARVAGYAGRIVEVDDERMPGGDGLPFPDQDWLLDTRRIRDELRFAEVSSYEFGIRATIDWQKSHPNLNLNPRDFDYAAEDAFLCDSRL